MRKDKEMHISAYVYVCVVGEEHELEREKGLEQSENKSRKIT